MTNSDPFTHLHRRRAGHTRAALTVLRRQLDALDADLDRMLSARRVDDIAPGSGLAGGGRGTDIADPTGNTALRHDRAAEGWARFDLSLAEAFTAGNALTSWRQYQLGDDATPTGLCRDGACPETKMADRGTRAKDATPRCHACYWYWCHDASNPAERRERPEPGASPRRLGLERVDVA